MEECTAFFHSEEVSKSVCLHPADSSEFRSRRGNLGCVNRSDLQRLSELRLGEAQVLLEAGRLEGACYLLGYAVECTLKSRIAMRIREFDFPDKKLSNDSYVHDLSKLMTVAGLKNHLEREEKENEVLMRNWALVKEWSEDARYEPVMERERVLAFFAAVTDPSDGVLPWLMKYC